MYDFSSLLVNGGPLSEIMVFGKPCLANVFSNESIVEVADVFRTTSTSGYRVRPSIITRRRKLFGKGPKSQHIQCPIDALESRQCITVQGSLGCQHFDMEDNVLPRSLLDCLFLETILSLLAVVWFSPDLDIHGEQGSDKQHICNMLRRQ